jgi:hypothetical protein
MDKIDRIIEELKKLSLANEDITRYGDGYEDAIRHAREVVLAIKNDKK